MEARSTLDIARGYVAAGLSVIPIRPDGSKAPAVASWRQYQHRLPTDAELHLWFAAGRNGIAVLCGKVSGNLEVLDFDSIVSFHQWAELLERDHPGVLAGLPLIETPAGGRHVYLRLPYPPSGSRKLAMTEDRQHVLVEAKGEGGYVLAPGSPPACHPSGRPYRHLSGPPLTAVPMPRGDACE